MPRCAHCGKVNRDGSLFCQDCGQRLEAEGAASAASPAGATCGACGTANVPGMNFCKMCGTSLATAPAAARSEATPGGSVPSKAVCPACGKGTPVGFAFCQHCGQRLEVGAPGVAPPVSTAATMAVVNPTPPAGLGRPSAVSGAVGGARPESPRSEAFAATVAPSSEILASVRAGLAAGPQGAGEAAAAPRTGAAAPVSRVAPVAAPAAPAAVSRDTVRGALDPAPPISDAPRWGTLVAMNRDGSDGQSMPISGETFDVGRTEGSLIFQEDPYLGARHLRLLQKDGQVLLRPLDLVNGVFVRLREGCDLESGDHFLLGKELLRYEAIAATEREPAQLSEHGVLLFGTVPREAWGRLRQLTAVGTTRDVWHLGRPELVLGREEGDVTFPDDEFMSRRHAAVKRVGSRVRLEDLGSSNGTFVRVRGDRVIKPGDLLRAGDQLLRFEA